MEKKLLLPEQIVSILKDIVDRVHVEQAIEKIILYGSYSKGSYTPESDVDIAFFLSDISQGLRQIHGAIYRICSQYDVDVQPQVFYSAELEYPIGIVEEIVKYGIDITDL